MTPKEAKRLIGRTIVAVDLNATWESEEGSKHRRLMHDPVFTLDDGSRLSFVVQEHPEGAEYGVCPIRRGGKRTLTAREWIRTLMDEIKHELDTAGLDEVKENPMLQGKWKTLRRAAAYLDATKPTDGLTDKIVQRVVVKRMVGG